MTNLEATWLYRRAIAEAIQTYNVRLKAIRTQFAGHSDCLMSARIEAYATLRVQWHMADLKLAAAREFLMWRSTNA